MKNYINRPDYFYDTNCMDYRNHENLNYEDLIDVDRYYWMGIDYEEGYREKMDRIEKERIEKERIEKERIEKERIEKERNKKLHKKIDEIFKDTLEYLMDEFK